jgi:nucleoside-triphosphatase
VIFLVFMKYLITGVPHAGKSTLINSLVTGIEKKQGFVTAEVLQDGQRTGFELVSAASDRALLASINSQSHTRVSRYGVNVELLDDFIARLPEPTGEDLLYIDEIGQMELYSSAFRGLVRNYLEMPNHFIGTLTSVYEDDFTAELASRPDLMIFNLTLENRDSLGAEIAAHVAKYIH